MMVLKALLAIRIEVGLLCVQLQNIIKTHHAN
jgi:hypothetical protein